MFRWIRKNSLVIVGLGLMLASSGLDGAYMSKWMSHQLWFLGYVLNTMSDITGFVLTYWYGVFQQSKDETKRQMSKVLLIGEAVGIAYSWAFSWRQLRFVIPAIETNPITGQQWEVEVVAFVAAGFIPLTLALVGYAQSLQVTSDDLDLTTSSRPTAQPQRDVAPEPVKTEEIGHATPTVDDLNAARSESKQARVNAMLDAFLDDPHATQVEVADRVGVSRSTISNYLNELETDGVVKRNGDGVQVLTT